MLAVTHCPVTSLYFHWIPSWILLAHLQLFEESPHPVFNRNPMTIHNEDVGGFPPWQSRSMSLERWIRGGPRSLDRQNLHLRHPQSFRNALNWAFPADWFRNWEGEQWIAFHLVYDLVDETGLNRTVARGGFDHRAWTNVHSSRISCLCLRPVLTKNHYVCEHSVGLCNPHLDKWMERLDSLVVKTSPRSWEGLGSNPGPAIILEFNTLSNSMCMCGVQLCVYKRKYSQGSWKTLREWSREKKSCVDTNK